MNRGLSHYAWEGCVDEGRVHYNLRLLEDRTKSYGSVEERNNRWRAVRHLIAHAEKDFPFSDLEEALRWVALAEERYIPLPEMERSKLRVL